MTYKFLKVSDGKLRSCFGNHEWMVGTEYEISGEVELCLNGFHASDRIIDAFSFVQGNILAIVEGGGDCITTTDKSVWQKMRIIRAYHWTPEDSVALAVVAAESVLPIYESWAPGDDRPRRAINLARDADADAAAARAAAAAAARASTDAAYAAVPARADAAVAAAAARAAAAAARASTDAADAAAPARAGAAAAAADAAAAAARAARAAAAARASTDAADAAYAASYAADAAYAASLAVTEEIEEWLVGHIAELRPYA